MPHGAGRIRIGRALGRAGCLTLFGVVLLGAVPASSVAARAEPPPILGNWEAAGFGEIHVRSVGSHFSGTIVSPDPDSICPLRVGSEAWRVNDPITVPPNSWRFPGSMVWSYTNPCMSAGFGVAQWTFASVPDSGQYCSTPPGGGAQFCDNFFRVGLLPSPLAPYSVSSVLVKCMSDTAFYQRTTFYCNQLYYAAHPGKVKTQVYLCTMFTTGWSFIYGTLPVCPQTIGSSFGPRASHARRAAQFRRPRKKVKVLRVAAASMTFSKPGYKGFDLKPTKRARRILKKSAKHHKRLPLTVVSTFRSSSGKTIQRRRHFVIKP